MRAWGCSLRRPAALLLLLTAAPASGRLVSYYVYPESSFEVNRVCPGAPELAPTNDRKHAVDLLFLRDVLGHFPGAAGADAPAAPDVGDEAAAAAEGLAADPGSGGGDAAAPPPPPGRYHPAGARVHDPERAEVFVVPVACAQCLAQWGKNTSRTAPLWRDLLRQLTHLRWPKRDHLLVCGEPGLDAELKALSRLDPPLWLPSELMLGVFRGSDSAHAPRIGTGHATFGAVLGLAAAAAAEAAAAAAAAAGGSAAAAAAAAAAALPPPPPPRPPPLPASARRYRLLYVGDGGRAGGDCGGQARARLESQARSDPSAVPPDFLVLPGGLPYANLSAAVRDSLAVLVLGAVGPTSDRLYEAFEGNALVAALDCDYFAFMAALPHHFRVPWRQLVVWVGAKAWERDPLGALKAALDALPPGEAQRRLELAERHRPDVTWGRPDSRASQNVLEEAYRRSKYLPN